jgi:hypothetical protein
MSKRSDLSMAQRKDDPKRRCTAHRKDGGRCKRAPILGGSVCATHGGSAGQVRAKAQRRLMAAVDVLMVELLEIAKSAESEGVRLAAVNSALDRAGLSAKQFVDVAISAKWDETFEGGTVTVGDGTTDTLSDDETKEIAALNAAAEIETKEPRAITRGGGAGDEDDDMPVVLRGVVVDPDERQVMIPSRVVEALRRSGIDI